MRSGAVLVLDVWIGTEQEQLLHNLEAACFGGPHQRGLSIIGACPVRVGRVVQQQPRNLEMTATWPPSAAPISAVYPLSVRAWFGSALPLSINSIAISWLPRLAAHPSADSLAKVTVAARL